MERSNGVTTKAGFYAYNLSNAKLRLSRKATNTMATDLYLYDAEWNLLASKIDGKWV
tara:strand:- start:5130 stop:5300 length:171 start_codon:yes stop_codon:yes gene_type:complete